MHYLLLALEGDSSAARWLADNSRSVDLFSRALAGEKEALARFNNGQAVELDDLFEVMDNDDLDAFLQERRPELRLLFAAIKGDDGAAAQLRHKKAALAQLVPVLREIHAEFLDRTQNDNGVIEDGAVADMGCLIGEMHLKQGEFEKAAEAFSRAIDTRPAADLYEGRARAYRLLAERDEAAARLLRQG